MNKYSPHEAFGKTLVYAGERLQFIGGRSTLCVHPRNLAPPGLFIDPRGVAAPESKGILIHWICTSRVHPVRGKGLSHLVLCSTLTFTLFCPTQRTTGDLEGVSHVSARTTRPPQP